MSSMVRGPTGEIPVDIEKRNDGMHFVSFTPVAFRVSIAPGIDAKKVTFSGLKEGIMGQALRADIDVREAGKGGTLTARCQGPTKRADIDLKDNMNGTFGLTIRPQEGGRHLLEIKYGGEHIQGSPFVLRIAGATDPSKVRVFGPGLKNGLLHTFKGNFICETRGAGAGQLKVRVHGPRGAFRVEMQPLSSKDRTIAVKYNPVEPGDYDIDVKWSDVHVPGSPFRVSIFETQDELDEFEGRQISRIGGSTSRHSRHSGPEYNSYQWQEEI